MEAQLERRVGGDDRSEKEALETAIREGLKAHPTFEAIAVDVGDVHASARHEGRSESTWTAMDENLDVLSGTALIEWTDSERMSGRVTVLVGSAGLWT